MNAAVVSIHDVMPETLHQVDGLLGLLQSQRIDRVTLLVVPGRPWSAQGIRQLRRWQEQGFDLAGHGWRHYVHRPRSLYARLHSRLLSRNAAEHLDLDEDAIAALMKRNHRWFRVHGLTPPALYVPPAWALGAITRATLSRLPFHYVETLTGLYDVPTRRFQRLPVVGFEADTKPRAWVLKAANASMYALGTRRTVRIAIHPHDPDLYLEKTLKQTLQRVTKSLGYEAVA